MAKPIKETPILTGRDAKIFNDKMNASKNITIQKEERDRIKSNFKALNSIAQF